MSPFLPRSILESYIPYAILRSIYSQYYSNSSSGQQLALLNSSPRHSPSVALGHSSLAAAAARQQPHREYSTHASLNDSGYFNKPSSSSHIQNHQLYETDSGSIEIRHWNMRRSGPLDYSDSRKVKHMEGSTSSSTGPRSAISKSGPLSYKYNNK